MTKAVLAILAPLLTSCGPKGESPAPGSAPAPTSSVARVGPSPVENVRLAGEYRVAGVDGDEIDQPYAVTASVTGDRIHVTADCLNFAWRYTIAGNRIATERMAVEGCARGLTAAEEAVVAAIDAAQDVSRSPANAVELRGQGRVLTLFSQ